MKISEAEKYLKYYQDKTTPIFDDFAAKKIKESEKIGRIPTKLLSSFFEIAKKGKKIRGSLIALGYKAAGGTDEKSILDTSLFIELIHTGLLVHDDIQDRDNTRRGLPTIHKQFGKASEHYGMAMGINAGISAYFLGYETLMSGNFPKDKLIYAGKITSEYITRVSHGQALDVSNMFIDSISQKELLNILKYKTAEYTGVLPLLVGAILAGKTDKKYLGAIKEYGLCLGWAFQIQDDILGAFGDIKKIGKPVGSDFKEGKVTLLMLHLAEHGTKEQKEIQKNILGTKNISKKQVKQMQNILKESGSYDYVTNLGWDYVKNGEKFIPQITSDKELQKIFKSLLNFMMERTL